VLLLNTVSGYELQVPQETIAPRSNYLKYLPGVYAEHDFTSRFLMILESVLSPLERTIDNISYYFDPTTTPEEFLPWLASWLKISLMKPESAQRQRELLTHIGDVFEWRGTKRGLTEYIRLHTGVTPIIEEDFSPLVLTGSSLLGINTVLGGNDPSHFTVRLQLNDSSDINRDQIIAIIESEKPVHTRYSLEVFETS
jgi:phage tail-like protein